MNHVRINKRFIAKRLRIKYNIIAIIDPSSDGVHDFFQIANIK